MKKLSIYILLALLLTSCGAYKRQAYLQDMIPGVTYDADVAPDARIAKGDKLNILVTASEPILAKPFNLVTGESEFGTVSGKEGISSESQTDRSYTVDRKGNINFPVLGRIYVEGMTLEDLTNTIEGQIINTGMIKEPIVLAEFGNFQITMLGEINGVGNYNIPDGSINIFEALALAGDITDDGQKDQVWVIRTVGDARKVYSLNLKSKDVYSSPAFYLQQNDMLYVKPKNTKFDTAIENLMTVGNSILSLFSFFTNTWLWYTVYTR